MTRMRDQIADIQTRGIGNRSGRVAHGNDPGATMGQLVRHDRADVAEPLNHDTRAGEIEPEIGGGLFNTKDDAAPG